MSASKIAGPPAAGRVALLAALLALAGRAVAQEAKAPVAPSGDEAASASPFAIHLQTTDIFQYHPAFHSDYQGAQSFDHRQHTGNTLDMDLYLGFRPWRGGELWVDPELNQGFAPNDTLGIAGYVNGDGSKVGKAHAYTRFQRVFVRQSFDLGGERNEAEPDLLQFGGPQVSDRIVVTAGKFNPTDVFDTNAYAHDSRHDFLNWSLIDTGSFDYAADAWGFSYGVTAEAYLGDWAFRAGLFDMSDVPNSEHLTEDLTQFQTVAEIEHRHKLFGQDGAVRATVFVSRARMGTYAEALGNAAAAGGTPDTGRVRRYASRPGGSLNAEQALTPDLGVFLRAGWDDGTEESYEYTDIDRTLAAGVQIKGALWGRKDDAIGVAGVVDDISAVHARYLAAGGLGILIGDGRLDRRGAERIGEGYYSLAVASFARVSFDAQLIANPAYNRDRGPVQVLGLRLHLER